MNDESVTLAIDPIACEGIGICAHLAPDLISVDPWGYPVVPQRPLAGPEVGQARRAVRGCSRRALHLRQA